MLYNFFIVNTIKKSLYIYIYIYNKNTHDCVFYFSQNLLKNILKKYFLTVAFVTYNQNAN